MTALWQVNVRDSVVFDIMSRLVSEKKSFAYDFHNQITNSRGLYCFWLRDSCLYVGMSEDLQRRIAEHSHAEDNPLLIKYFKAYSNEIKISFIYLDFSTDKLKHIESKVILELRPMANRKGLENNHEA